jgi:peptidoglycan DL-endopeptidase CwlO
MIGTGVARCGRARAARIALPVCVVLASVAVAPGALAAPAPTIAAVRARVTALHAQAEAATERYDGLREEMAQLDVRLAGARSRLVQGETSVVLARREFARWAAETYKGGDLATLSLFLSDDPDLYLRGNGTIVSMADRRAQALESLLRERRGVVAAGTDVEEQQQRLVNTSRELERTRRDIEAQLARAERELSRLTGGQRATLAAEDEGRDRSGLAGAGVRLPASGRPTCDDVPKPSTDARAGKVIAYACAQLGDPYQYAASGPDRFDCSGLTMMAWKQAGVSLPHNAAQQAKLGTTVARADLRPGDLVFFFRPIGHNGIYLGNGLMIHAPRTGDRVKIAPVSGIGSYTTAVRL